MKVIPKVKLTMPPRFAARNESALVVPPSLEYFKTVYQVDRSSCISGIVQIRVPIDSHKKRLLSMDSRVGLYFHWNENGIEIVEMKIFSQSIGRLTKCLKFLSGI